MADPDKERAVAKEMVRRFGGRISLHLRSQTQEASRYFIAQRQMSLPFDSFLSLPARAPTNARKRRAAAASAG
jgi:hypothetical protein